LNHRGTEAQRKTNLVEIIRDKDPLTKIVIGSAIEVHRHLGPGLLESVYEECLCHELSTLGIEFERQVQLPLEYKGVSLEYGLRLDILIPGKLVIELKTVEKIMPIHEAQLLTYLKLASIPTGLLINFNVPVLRDGIRRMVL
jgi:GxxExxY protein